MGSQCAGPLAWLCGLVKPPGAFSSLQEPSPAQSSCRGAWAPLPSELTSHAVRYRIAVAVWAATNRAAPQELAGCSKRSSQGCAGLLSPAPRRVLRPGLKLVTRATRKKAALSWLHTTFGIQILLLSCSAALAQSAPRHVSQTEANSSSGRFLKNTLLRL